LVVDQRFVETADVEFRFGALEQSAAGTVTRGGFSRRRRAGSQDGDEQGGCRGGASHRYGSRVVALLRRGGVRAARLAIGAGARAGGRGVGAGAGGADV